MFRVNVYAVGQLVNSMDFNDYASAKAWGESKCGYNGGPTYKIREL